MSFVFLGTRRRSRLTILMASSLISNMLLMRANKGARGNAATKMVVKLNWRTNDTGKNVLVDITVKMYKMHLYNPNMILQSKTWCYTSKISLCWRCWRKVQTHFQKLIKQGESINITQVIVFQPVTKVAEVTWMEVTPLLSTCLPVTVTTLSANRLSFCAPKTQL